MSRAYPPLPQRQQRADRLVFTEAELRRVIGYSQSLRAATVRLGDNINLSNPISLSGVHGLAIDGGGSYYINAGESCPFIADSPVSDFHLQNLAVSKPLDLFGIGVSAVNVTDVDNDVQNISCLANTMAVVSAVETDGVGATNDILTLPTDSDRGYVLRADLVGRDTSNGDVNAYSYLVKAKNTGGIVTLSAVTQVFIDEDNAPIVYAVAVSGTNVVFRVDSTTPWVWRIRLTITSVY